MNILFQVIFTIALFIFPTQSNADIFDDIRDEALKPPFGEQGRPLPLAAHWNIRTWDAFYQSRLIEAGHHILPSVPHPQNDGTIQEDKLNEFYKPILTKWSEWNIPFTVRDNNWLRELQKPPFRDLPEESNPLTITPEGKINNRPSPFGALDVWQKAGHRWTNNPMIKALQDLYPNPPLVIFLSNNETRKLRWHELDNSKRFIERYGKNASDEKKREVTAKNLTERFQRFFTGFRNGLSNETWKENALLMGYNAFGPAFYGRWEGWKEYAIPTEDQIAIQPLFWDGGSPSYYDNNWEQIKTDYRVWSVQCESMNWVFMLHEAWQINPDFWFEMSVWDGDRSSWVPGEEDEVDPANSKPIQYIRRGQSWTTDRYHGRVQYGMWIIRPRSVREFRGHVQPREDHRYEDYWLAFLKAVDKVWQNETLTEFWRFGELVPNRDHKHPWQANVLDKYKDEDRWFLLNTNLDAPWPWDNETEIKVFSLAHRIGEKPNRRWLVYAHSPLKSRKGVKVEIPEYKKITIDVPVAGVFYEIDENKHSVKKVE